MTQYEYLKVVQDIADIMRENGMTVNDARYVTLYESYCRLCREKHKRGWIVAYLCEQYGISQPTLYYIIRKMRREIVI